MFGDLLGLSLLIWALWPALRLLGERRLFQWYPRTYLGLAGIALSVLILLNSLPGLSLPLGVAFVLLRLLGRLRWSAYSLPPGTLTAPNFRPFVEPNYFEAVATTTGPIFKMSTLFQPTFCVASLEAGWDLLAQDGLESPPLRYDRLLPGGVVRYMRPEQHARYRGLIAKAVTGAVVEQSSTYFREAVERAVERLKLQPPPEPRSLMRSMIEEAMTGALLGLKKGDREFERARELLRQIDLGRLERDILPWKPERARTKRAAGELAALVSRFRNGPMVSALPPQALSDPVVVYNLIFSVHIACGDVSGLLTWMLQMLGLEPQWLDLAEPEAIVLETLRLEQSEYIIRRASRDVKWRGYEIPKGWMIRVCVREAHRLAPIADASSFRPDRPAGGHVRPFGAHRHTCPGRQMALALGALLVRELSQYQLQLLDSGPREFDGWHWTPGSRLRVLVLPK